MACRESCINCSQKHISQAIVLLDEAALGYPIHRLLAFGHMAEAESELIKAYLSVAELIREERVKATEDKNYQPTLMEVLELLSAIEEQNSKDANQINPA